MKLLSKAATLNVNDPLIKALEGMSEGRHPYRIVVTNGEGKVVGILTGRRVLEVLMGARGTGIAEKIGLEGALKERIGIFMDECHEAFTEEIGIEGILKFMHENAIGYAAIVDQTKRLKGVVLDVAILEALRGKKFNATVGGFMSSDVITSSAGSSVNEVARTMVERRVRRLPLVDPEGKVRGIITTGDIIRFILSRVREGRGLENEIERVTAAPAFQIATKETVNASPDEDIGDVIERVLDHGISSVLIVDSEGRIKGIATRIDLLRAAISSTGIEALKAEING